MALHINSISLGYEDWFVEATPQPGNRISGSLFRGDQTLVRPFNVTLTNDRFVMVGAKDEHGFKIKLTFAYSPVEVDPDILQTIQVAEKITLSRFNNLPLEDRYEFAKLIIESYLHLKKD